MRKLLFVLVAITITLTSFTQENTSDNKKSRQPLGPTAWKAGGSISILGGAGSSKDHYSRLNSSFGFVYGGYVKLWAEKSWGRNVWTNSLAGGYLRASSSDKDDELNENKIEFNARYGYKLKNAKWQPGLVVNARSQIANGFDYSYATPKRTSGFFAPAFITLSVGTNWQLSKDLNVFFGPAVRWITITNRPYSLNYQGGIKPDGSTEPTLASYYNVDAEKQVRYQAGILLTGSWKKDLNKTTTIRSCVDLMYDFRDDPLNINLSVLSSGTGANSGIDINWSTGININVCKLFTVAGNFDLIYDQDISNKVMYRGMAGLGFICRF